MSRIITVGAAQLGPIQRADSRASVVKRMLELLRQAAGHGCNLVVFPELALTTFFPRWWMTDPEEIDSFFEREMPGNETAPLFNEAQRLGIGFYLGFAEIERRGPAVHRFNTSILVDGVGQDRRPVPQDPSPRPRRARALARLPAPGEALLRGGRSGLGRVEEHGRQLRHVHLQ